MVRRLAIIAVAAGPVALIAGGAEAAVFELASGGRLYGELVNKGQSPRTTYRIRTSLGGHISLARDQVARVVERSPNREEYERIRGDYADTVEGQWELAQWCRTRHLMSLRKVHLNRVVALDADHELARRALGFVRRGEGWVTQADLMKAEGYVWFEGRWRLPQEVELRERRRKKEVAEREWFRTLQRWRRWLTGDRATEAKERIRTIDDIYAVRAIHERMREERSAAVRKLYVEALVNINKPTSLRYVVRRSLSDASEDVRLTALERLADVRPAGIAGQYIDALKSPTNVTVNRAADGLRYLESRGAVAPLIDALVTRHQIVLRQGGGNPDMMSTSFSTGPGGGGGMSVGGPRAKAALVTYQNHTVLQALVQLTGVNFFFDQKAWKAWYGTQRQSTPLSTGRRD